MPFLLQYVVLYSSKFKNKEFDKFFYIIKKLNEKSKFEKEEFINIINLVYDLNPDGKGKKRKRTLPDILSIIEEKYNTK